MVLDVSHAITFDKIFHRCPQFTIRAKKKGKRFYCAQSPARI